MLGASQELLRHTQHAFEVRISLTQRADALFRCPSGQKVKRRQAHGGFTFFVVHPAPSTGENVADLGRVSVVLHSLYGHSYIALTGLGNLLLGFECVTFQCCCGTLRSKVGLLVEIRGSELALLRECSPFRLYRCQPCPKHLVSDIDQISERSGVFCPNTKQVTDVGNKLGEPSLLSALALHTHQESLEVWVRHAISQELMGVSEHSEDRPTCFLINVSGVCNQLLHFWRQIAEHFSLFVRFLRTFHQALHLAHELLEAGVLETLQ